MSEILQLSLKEFIKTNWRQKSFWIVFGLGAGAGALLIAIIAIAGAAA